MVEETQKPSDKPSEVTKTKEAPQAAQQEVAADAESFVEKSKTAAQALKELAERAKKEQGRSLIAEKLGTKTSSPLEIAGLDTEKRLRDFLALPAEQQEKALTKAIEALAKNPAFEKAVKELGNGAQLPDELLKLIDQSGGADTSSIGKPLSLPPELLGKILQNPNFEIGKPLQLGPEGQKFLQDAVDKLAKELRLPDDFQKQITLLGEGLKAQADQKSDQPAAKKSKVITNEDFASATPEKKVEAAKPEPEKNKATDGKPQPVTEQQFSDHKELTYADNTVVKEFKDGHTVKYDAQGRITKVEFVPVKEGGPKETYEFQYGKDNKMHKVTHTEPGPPPKQESFKSDDGDTWIRNQGGQKSEWKGSFIVAENNILILEKHQNELVQTSKSVYGTDRTITDKYDEKPKVQEKPAEKKPEVDKAAMEKVADELYDAQHGGYTLGIGTDKDKIYALLKDKTEDERKAIDEAYQRKYNTTLDKDFRSEMEGADLDKALNLLNRKDGSADEAGRIHTALLESGQYFEGRSAKAIEKDVRETLAALNSKDIAKLEQEYQDRYQVSLRDALMKDPNLSDTTKQALDIYLKGSDKRSDADVLKLGDLALQNRDLDMFQEAFGKASPAAREAFIKNGGEQKMLLAFGTPDTSIKSIFKNVLSGGLTGVLDAYEAVKGEKLQQAKEIAADGSISAASEVRANTSLLGDTERGIENAVNNLNEKQRLDYFKGKELSAANANESGLNEADKKALAYYKNLRSSLEAAGNETEVAAWEDRIRVKGGSLITKIAGEEGIDDNEANVYEHIENLSKEDWQRLKSDPKYYQEIKNTLATFMEPDEVKRGTDILDKQLAAKSYEEAKQVGRRPILDAIGDYNGVTTDERKIVEALAKMSPDEQKLYRDNAAFKKSLDEKLAGALEPGPEKAAADNLLKQISEGKKPQLDIISKLNLHAGEREESDAVAKVAGLALLPTGLGGAILADQYGGDGQARDLVFGSNANAVISDLEQAFKDDPGLRQRIKDNPNSEEAKQFYSALHSALRDRDFERYAKPLIEKGELSAELRLEFSKGVLNDDEIKAYEDLAKLPQAERDRLLANNGAEANKLLTFLDSDEQQIAKNVLKQGEFRPEDKLRAYQLGVGTGEAEIKEVLKNLTPEQKEQVKKDYFAKYKSDLQSDLLGELGGADADDANEAILRGPVNDSDALARARDRYTKSRDGIGSTFVDTFWDGTGMQSDKAYNDLRNSIVEASSKFQQLPPEVRQEKIEALATALENFRQSKEGAADAVTDAAIAIVGVGAAAFTGGVSLSLLAYTGAAGALLKAGIKAGIMGGDYDLNSAQLITDLASGFVDAGLNVLGPGEIGALIKVGEKAGVATAKTVTKELGEQFIKQGLKDGAEQTLQKEAVKLVREAITSGAKGVEDDAIRSLAESLVKKEIDSATSKLTREEIVDQLAASIKKGLAENLEQESKSLLRRSLEEVAYNSAAGAIGGGAGAAVRWNENLTLEENLKAIGLSAGIGGVAGGGASLAFKGAGEALKVLRKPAGEAEEAAVKAADGALSKTAPAKIESTPAKIEIAESSSAGKTQALGDLQTGEARPTQKLTNAEDSLSPGEGRQTQKLENNGEDLQPGEGRRTQELSTNEASEIEPDANPTGALDFGKVANYFKEKLGVGQEAPVVPIKGVLVDGKIQPLNQAENLIGRSGDAAVKIDPNNTLVSGKHAYVRNKADGVYIENISKSQSTFVNGKAIEGEYKLKPGDHIMLGRSVDPPQPGAEFIFRGDGVLEPLPSQPVRLDQVAGADRAAAQPPIRANERPAEVRQPQEINRPVVQPEVIQAASPTPAKPQVILVEGERLNPGKEVILGKVGSQSGGIDVDGPGTGQVSKRHASIRTDENGNVYIKDVGSTNGTFVNGERLQPGREVQIRPTDRVSLGNYELQRGSSNRYFDTSTAPKQMRALDGQTVKGKEQFLDASGQRLPEGSKASRSAAVRVDIEGNLYIKDLKSQEGIYVNGEKIPSGSEVRLKQGDQVRVGENGRILPVGETLEPSYQFKIARKNQDYILEPGQEVPLGRNDFPGKNPFISSDHVRIGQDANGLYLVETTASPNGTFVNGERLTPGQRRYIKPTDEIALGNPRIIDPPNNPHGAFLHIIPTDISKLPDNLIAENRSFYQHAVEQSNQFATQHEVTERLEDGFATAGKDRTFNADGKLGNVNRHAVVVDRANDPILRQTIEEARQKFGNLPPREKAAALTDYVNHLMNPQNMGGDALDDWLDVFNPYSAGERIPLGEYIRQGKGVCVNQALLYKVLGDELGLDVALVRGTGLTTSGVYNHAWNHVKFPDEAEPLIYDPRQHIKGAAYGSVSAHERGFLLEQAKAARAAAAAPPVEAAPPVRVEQPVVRAQEIQAPVAPPQVKRVSYNNSNWETVPGSHDPSGDVILKQPGRRVAPDVSTRPLSRDQLTEDYSEVVVGSKLMYRDPKGNIYQPLDLGDDGVLLVLDQEYKAVPRNDVAKPIDVNAPKPVAQDAPQANQQKIVIEGQSWDRKGFDPHSGDPILYQQGRGKGQNIQSISVGPADLGPGKPYSPLPNIKGNFYRDRGGTVYELMDLGEGVTVLLPRPEYWAAPRSVLDN